MGVPFMFPRPMFMGASMPMTPTVPASIPGFPMIGPALAEALGLVPTLEQQEEYSLAFLKDQKQHMAQLKEYFQQCIKSLDASQEAIEQQVSKIHEARKRRQSEASPASEARSKR